MKQKQELIENFAQVAEKIRKDPQTYRTEFCFFYDHLLAVVACSTTKTLLDVKIEELVTFLATVSFSYNKERELGKALHTALYEKMADLKPSIKRTLITAVAHLAQKGALNIDAVLETFFSVLKHKDKQARVAATKCIVASIKKKSSKKTRKTIADILKHSKEKDALCCLGITAKLYWDEVWCDAKTADMVAEACFSENKTLALGTAEFMQGNRKDLKKDSGNEDETPIPAPVELVSSPRKLAARLLAHSKTPGTPFAARLSYYLLISRIVSFHRVSIDEFFLTLQRHITPAQSEFSKLFLCCINATTAETEEEVLAPLVMKIYDGFVRENLLPQKIASAINTIGEMYKRNASVLTDDVFEFIKDFKTAKENCVSSAARSLINLKRDGGKTGKESGESEEEEFDPVTGGVFIKEKTDEDETKSKRGVRIKKERKTKDLKNRKKNFLMTMGKRRKAKNQKRFQKKKNKK
ncbi:MAG: uncharacterized protein A8A55_1687 [Amphiamblys sp. WSBS2006]|nr:MAG: uncharacterized protein A8A55_1687 [Amphiamblys sp. WSBS2006]